VAHRHAFGSLLGSSALQAARQLRHWFHVGGTVQACFGAGSRGGMAAV